MGVSNNHIKEKDISSISTIYDWISNIVIFNFSWKCFGVSSYLSVNLKFIVRCFPITHISSIWKSFYWCWSIYFCCVSVSWNFIYNKRTDSQTILSFITKFRYFFSHGIFWIRIYSFGPSDRICSIRCSFFWHSAYCFIYYYRSSYINFIWADVACVWDWLIYVGAWHQNISIHNYLSNIIYF